MRVGYTSDREKEKKKKDKKKQQSILEKEIMSIMEKGMKAALDRAIDDYEYGNYCPSCGARMESE